MLFELRLIACQIDMIIGELLVVDLSLEKTIHHMFYVERNQSFATCDGIKYRYLA